MKKTTFSITGISKKKFINTFLCMALIVTLGMGFTACSSGNPGNNPGSNDTQTLSAVSGSSSEGEADSPYALPNECSTLPLNAPALGEENNLDSSVVIGDIVQLGGVDWRVLDVNDGKALVLSDKILSKRGYNSQNVAITWEKCSLRQYLNEEFYDSVFSAEEKERIVETALTNNDSPWYGKEYQFGMELNSTSGGNDTTDKVFLLSIEEVLKYFGDSGGLENRETGDSFINDQFNENRLAETQAGPAMWWLRSPGNYYYACGSNHSFASCVTMDGVLSVHGDYVFNGNVGIRPAMWVNL